MTAATFSIGRKSDVTLGDLTTVGGAAIAALFGSVAADLFDNS
ncbi:MULTISPECIES: hypothetical protein [unclassified Sphingopyxis]|nr:MULTISPECIES: hypothetical protein [unclassified Sphingopyxis]